jgi:YHS domain-containing protein
LILWLYNKEGGLAMKNSGYEAWKARLEFFNKEYPFGPIQKFTNEEGRLHRDDGPAYISPTRICWYKDGRKHGIDADKFGSVSFYYENIRIPPKFYYKPEELTLFEVLAHANTEVRFVGMKIIGMDKVLKHKNTKIVHKDDSKGQVLFKIHGIFNDPVCYVKVVNSTAELDGTYKNYYLCVPPHMKTCQEAVAWTFRLEADEYVPQQET